jgi:hypothetical protein
VLGFAPLAALPLASLAIAPLVAVEEQLAATGAITFGGSASAGAKTPMSATGGLTFAGSPFLSAYAHRSATGGITFGGSALLRVAGRPLVFTALPESFQFRADGADFGFVTLTTSYDFRGVPE